MLANHLDTDEIMEATLEEWHATTRDVGIDDFTDFQTQIIGHDIGLDIHDSPLISARSNSIEPGVVMNYDQVDGPVGR